MNYFELYQIPVSFAPDQKKVTQQYLALQKKYHPDFFVNEPEADKEEALEYAAMANRAYKIFRQQDATIRYVLQLKGLLEEEEKYTLPPAFLMEVLELNEMKMDGAADAMIQERAKSLQQEILETVQPILDQYQDDTADTETLLKVKDYYYKNRYLQRLLDKP